MSHGDRVEALPPGFACPRQHARCAVAAMADERRRFYGVQFHPEVTHTPQGAALLERFVREICGCEALWTRRQHHRGCDRARARTGRHRQGAARALRRRGLLGGRRAAAPSDRRTARLRVRGSRTAAPGRGRSGHAARSPAPGRARDPRRRRGALPGRARAASADPEAKRKIIGRTFIEVFENEAHELRACASWRRARSIRT